MRLYCQSCGLDKVVDDKYAGKTVKCPKCKNPVTIGSEQSAAPAPAPPSAPVVPPAPATAAAGGVPGTAYSLDGFIQKTNIVSPGTDLFEMADSYLLQANVNGRVWTKMGSMVAYTGGLAFTREGMLEHGVTKLLKKAVSGEGARLTKAEGQGTLFLADNGKKVSILKLQNEALYVNGNDLLAFEDGLKWDIKIMKKITGMLAGGLFNVRMEGTGYVAITSHYNPRTFLVQPGKPVFTDPNATVAWSGNLEPDLKTDISLKTFLGRGSGESIQMKFEGNGFVVVQPYEELYFQSSQ